MRRTFGLVILVVILVAGLAAGQRTSERGRQRIEKEVRHQLLMLPYFGVFDNLAYKVDGNYNVTLLGQTIRPTLKSDAEASVKRIEGVERVNNRIEILPLSPFDDRIRRAVYRALYSQGSPLFRYGNAPVPSIHIIVRGGNVTLEGAVDNSGDRNIANIRANGVPGVFSVTNHLQVAR